MLFFVFALYFNKKSEGKGQFSSVGVAVTRYQQMRNVPIQNELSVTPSLCSDSRAFEINLHKVQIFTGICCTLYELSLKLQTLVSMLSVLTEQKELPETNSNASN